MFAAFLHFRYSLKSEQLTVELPDLQLVGMDLIFKLNCTILRSFIIKSVRRSVLLTSQNIFHAFVFVSNRSKFLVGALNLIS